MHDAVRRNDRRHGSQSDRKEERHALAHSRRRAVGSGRERARRAERRRSRRDRGRAVGLCHAGRRAGVEHRSQRGAHRRVARLRRGDDCRPAVRFLDADELQRRRGRLVGAARPRGLGRRRDDVARPDGLEQRLDVAARLGAPRHRDAGHLGGGDREAVEYLARGARPDLVRVAHARGARRSTRGASSGRSSRSSSTSRSPTTPAVRRR